MADAKKIRCCERVGIVLKLSRIAAVVTAAGIAPAVLLASSAFADGAAAPASSTRSAQVPVGQVVGQKGEEPNDKGQQAEKDRAEIQRIVSTGGPGVKDAGKAALNGTPADMRQFLETGQFEARDEDNEVLISRIIYYGARGVKDAGKAALKGTPEDRAAFLEARQFTALDDDNSVLITRIHSEGGPSVKAAAKAALKGTPEDRVNFIQGGQFEARAKDKKAQS
ncbi:ALF repeat-containing protein [Streptomyces sp. UNOC14_S4]|uniref:ALF repeat-containing protein n=1 Tax=Streptomyces sp. UNOC14_S4 TaxID=2872340 RepID=UPI001E470F8E|nr:ALF repeat-containing protein [Streptomyces sp. UNOC14_S4]MCC3767762.1 ALF repeat-containing protein [Streptomyces sp. UNOC14_S4]